MPKQHKGKKRASKNKKQRRDFLAGLHHALAALYYFVKLILTLLGKSIG
ncbi:MAG: hypothetical protein IJT21_11155 [Synergistaceae bacterium]|nr:hypothetical protein [Synergistaceae bacterium]